MVMPQRLIVPQHRISGTRGDVDFGLANRAIFLPFEVEERFPIASIEVNVITQNGNIDVGIYTIGGARLGSIGSTAVGSAGVQSFNITDLVLGPGRYYAAAVLSGTTAKLSGCELNLDEGVAGGAALHGMRQMAAALPLPVTATFATPTVSVAAFMALVRA